MILSELIPFLKSLETIPKKRLSQNFLIDHNTIEKILLLADVQPGETILEIGPGPGSLTKALLKKGAKVIAVEVDPIFAEHLDRFQNGNLTVYNEDFLKFPLFEPVKVVANLPYHITTPILEKLFQHPFSSITIMIQKEVAERIQAPVGCKEFGSLTLFVQFYSRIVNSFNVSSSCFYPQPKVDSTVIRLDAIVPYEINPFHLIHPAFQKRRKMLTGTLPYSKEQIRKALQSIGMREDARAEMLSLKDWIALAKYFRDLVDD